MSEHTPTTDEVRAMYGADEFGVPAPLGQPVPDFDRWLAGHDRKVAARAFEDAADFLLTDPTAGPGTTKRLRHRIYAAWLRERAKNIREAQS